MAALMQPYFATTSSKTGKPTSPAQSVPNACSLSDPAVSEAQLVARLQAQLAPFAATLQGADALGKQLSAGMTAAAQSTMALRLLGAFPLSSNEGLALMRITEALLRVPDAASAKQLIVDELAAASWQPQSNDWLAGLAGWGLRIGQKLLSTAAGKARMVVGDIALAIGRVFVRHFGGQFVFAQTIDAASNLVKPAKSYSFDMLGEQALTQADVNRFDAAYAHAIAVLGPQRQAGADVSVSIKLSALHARYSALQHAAVLSELVPRVARLVASARSFDLPVYIDAEEAARLELSLDVFDALSAKVPGWNGLGLAVQAYQTRALGVIEHVIATARRDARRIPVRLVKGAYWDTEIKRAQAEGLAGYPVFTQKNHTDISYLACSLAMLQAPAEIYSAFATHNAYSFAAVKALAAQLKAPDYEFQCLHGMGEPLYNAATSQGVLQVPARIYAPVGAFDALLPYLVRRLLENGANSSFLAQLADDDARLTGNTALLAMDNFKPAIEAPAALFAGRSNSAGVDFGVRVDAEALSNTPLVMPPVAIGFDAQQIVSNPATGQPLSSVAVASAAQIDASLAQAKAAQPGWQALAATERARLISAWGDALECDLPQFAALAVHEAGKTWPNAVADVREAVDFCRYYAVLSLEGNSNALTPLGTVCTISPWNFPLAIFTGQVAAALAAGNAVVAKPAEQTPLMALAAVAAAHAVGIPAEVLHIVCGDGRVGAALTQDARVDGVMFTGSLEVAKIIERVLHERSGSREVVLIAETSGLNALIVDSTALIDQAVQDIVASAFDSAGQRCSALRLLWVQDDVAERLMEALAGAMAKLRVGNPALLHTDIGPVIDQEALNRLTAHEATLQKTARLIARVATPIDTKTNGSFFAPCAYEITNLEAVRTETFGPILHVHRYRASELDSVISRTAALGYALTAGVHSRVKSRIAQVAQHASAGNVYINRNIIGAVVGSQPFGGGKKSGTGPKAGGPWALSRLQRNLHMECSQETKKLPGITGELNTRELEPRGIVACAGPTADDIARQLSLCAQLGLQAIDVRQEPAWMARFDIGAALHAQWSSAFAGTVAQQRDDILPIITLAADGNYASWRLFEERVISDNTAAVGGNVELLIG